MATTATTINVCPLRTWRSPCDDRDVLQELRHFCQLCGAQGFFGNEDILAKTVVNPGYHELVRRARV
ncbi:uncharacterized protein H6S33_005311 [Morchella sextelata]|uniref:uncharacterized protein n=1 Tax=Morchella sextelata TaxID=1174677 RepID=UPI001D03E4F5|nr:uncharacterized protein H6S33_005311 [Morchella sextelata]KAH0613425.1 hypothetical protein H6S33_005311 [Morchella sextelata]